MQELSVLLLSAELHEAVSQRLLTELGRCCLEAEVVEIVTIFWMAAKLGCAPPPNLTSTLGHPSLATALLLHDMKLDQSVEPNPPLEMVSRNFTPPTTFRHVQGVEVPRYFLSRLTKLQHESGLPFISQCAFEWAKSERTFPTAPLQGDIAHFVRSFGEGFTGGFASRAMLRMVTAYQRTLDVARTLWGLPDELAWRFAEDALPLDPTLAFLRPQRPSWLPAQGGMATADELSLAEEIRRVLDSLSATQPKSILLALESPVHVDSQTITVLSLVRWRRWNANPVDAKGLASRFYARQERGEYGALEDSEWGLATTVSPTTLDTALDPEADAAPMAVAYAPNRIGYLQRDLFPERLYFPMVTGGDHPLRIVPSGGELAISSESDVIATACYWNAGWGAVRPYGMSGLHGTTLIAEAFQHAQTEAPPTGYFYLWKVTRWRRSSDHGPFSQDEPVYGATSA
ncbi:protein of unknown function [Paraburkholderia kururiensis]